MNQNEKATADGHAPELHPLSDQQLQKVSGGAIIPCGCGHYECTSCTFSGWSGPGMNNCPRCGAPVRLLEYSDDDPSLE